MFPWFKVDYAWFSAGSGLSQVKPRSVWLISNQGKPGRLWTPFSRPLPSIYPDGYYMHGGDVDAVQHESKHTLTDPEGEPVDFVIAIKFVYQAVAFMVSQINLIHAPRYIWFMASDPRSCTILTALAGNVRCMPESSVARHGWCAP